MTQIALNRARIDALIGQLVTASVTQHVRVDFHIEARMVALLAASVGATNRFDPGTFPSTTGLTAGGTCNLDRHSPLK